MKKVLFYTDTPLLGGAENQMLLLARFLPRKQYQITLACSNYKSLNPWCQQFIEYDINVIRLHVVHKHDPRHYLYIKKLLPNFDILHLHIWNPASSRYALAAADKIPTVVTEHDPFVLSGMKGWLKNKLMKNVRRIIVASQAARVLVHEQNPALEKRTMVIPNGIDTALFKQHSALDDRDAFRRIHFGAGRGDRVVLCVAELHERKGQKYLIEAAALLHKEFPNLKIVFVGEGPQRTLYQKMSKPLGSMIQFLGQRKDIGKLMTAADLFVLPSIREAFGLVLLEASVCEIPIIASRVGGIPEIITDGKTGILVAPQNTELLAAALRDLLAHKNKTAQLTNAAYKRTMQEFNAKNMADKTAAVYDELTS